MKDPIVIVGLGEMGGVFARGFLRSAHPVIPVTRQQSIETVAAESGDPGLVVLAVAEADLHDALQTIPEAWKTRLCLLQNELLPGDWERHGYTQPTVISVWFEKKRGQDVKVLIPSPACGPQAALLEQALGSIGIPVRVLDSARQLLFELVRKNLYILTTNIAGLETGGTVSQLWAQHRGLAQAVAGDVIRLQEALTGQTFDPPTLIDAMLEAFAGDPEHRCMGRSAPARLQRALNIAAEQSVSVPALERMRGHLPRT